MAFWKRNREEKPKDVFEEKQQGVYDDFHNLFKTLNPKIDDLLALRSSFQNREEYREEDHEDLNSGFSDFASRGRVYLG